MIAESLTLVALLFPLGESPASSPAIAIDSQDQEDYKPLEPKPDDFDWIRLNSGEWLKGEILRMRDGSLEFDSDELDQLTLDWDDVAEVRSPRYHTILLEGQEKREGTLRVKDGKVVLGGESGESFDRSSLMAFIPGKPSESNYWSGKVSVGFVARRGNTSQTDLTAYLFTRRETAATRWDTTYNGAFSRTQGIETANNHRLNSRFDTFLSPRLFLTPASVTALRDAFSNIDIRLTPSAGAGYDLLDANTVSWEIGGGPAYQYTEYTSVEAGTPAQEDTFAVLGSTNLEWDVTPDIETKFGYNLTVPIPEADEYNHHFSTVISLDLVDSLDLDLTFTWDRVNKPRQDVDGNVPSPDDLRLSVGVGFEF